MENLITINAEPRKEISKRASKELRAQGMVPAIVYGITAESIPIAVKLSDIKGVLKSESRENSLLRISQGEKSKVDAMIKEIQYDYLSDHIIHIDFIRIDLNKPVEVEVPVVLEGEPIGVKTEDGLLEFISREILVRSLPTSIPKEIRIEISGLHINQSIKVENLPKSEAYQFLSPANTVICAVAVKAKEEVAEVAEVAEAAEVPAEGAAAAPEAAAGKEGDKTKEAAAGKGAVPPKGTGKEGDKGKEAAAGKGAAPQKGTGKDKGK
jgi:large subunit ribosomal protein L25